MHVWELIFHSKSSSQSFKTTIKLNLFCFLCGSYKNRVYLNKERLCKRINASSIPTRIYIFYIHIRDACLLTYLLFTRCCTLLFYLSRRVVLRLFRTIYFITICSEFTLQRPSNLISKLSRYVKVRSTPITITS